MRRVLKHLLRQQELLLPGDGAGAQRVQNGAIVLGVDDNADVLPVFGRRAQHGRTADVDIFNGLFKRDVRPQDGFLKGVQVDGHNVNGHDAQLAELLHVLRLVAHGENAGVYRGVQRLDAAVETFREPRDVRHLGARHRSRRQRTGRAARRQDFVAQLGKSAGKLDNARLVRDAQ